ncbi:sigma-70 family RNA polymerase sigma factor [Devosia sp. MC1541]|uniref:sigma-70 family RNA polymerase sigma factor n=1 Tax=Devosia sp. MC1541 TaxID=2725264 RepID=UPI00145F4397|nr:sigma-70 family RNA polymerase sigma factor [Devosia sp. MC1541]
MTNRLAKVIDHLPDLRRYALTLAREPQNAEDLVQETLVRAYEKRRSFKIGGSLKTWLMSIMHNCFVDGYRRSVVRTSADKARVGSVSYPPNQDDAVQLSEVRRGFLLLSDEQREALHLIAIEGLTYPEAAQVLNVPEGTLLSRVSRARKALRSGELLNPPRHLKIVGSTDND